MPCLTAKNIVLLLFSLVFYAWSGPSFVLILVGETFVCWLFSYLESKARKKHTKKSLFVTNVILLLGFLCFFKYAMMLLSAFNGIFALDMKIPEIVLPIGISFYTFQLITYAADVHTKKVSVQKNFFTLLLYAAMFHQCIAGPIVRYGSIADEIKKRSLDINDFFEGMVRFSIGLAKKAEELVSHYDMPIKVAVMGCPVNGPGEAKEADIGIAGGKGEGLIFRNGEILRKVPEDRLLAELKAELDAMAETYKDK